MECPALIPFVFDIFKRRVSGSCGILYYCGTVRDTESRLQTLVKMEKDSDHIPSETNQPTPPDNENNLTRATDCVRMEFVIMRHAEGHQWTVDFDDH